LEKKSFYSIKKSQKDKDLSLGSWWGVGVERVWTMVSIRVGGARRSCAPGRKGEPISLASSVYDQEKKVCKRRGRSSCHTTNACYHPG